MFTRNKTRVDLPRLAFVREMIDTYDRGAVSDEISPAETMVGDNYLWVGESAVEVIVNCIAASLLTEVRHVLDLPCGHGRVLRHLVELFPQAKFDVCDLDEDGADFCATAFAASVVPARPDLSEVTFPVHYDLIWIGSLFTHLPEATVQRYLEHLAAQLSPKGIIVATFHGRWAQRMQELIPYTDPDRWSAVQRGFAHGGYGYADYAPGLGHDFVPGNYGISAVRPDRLLTMIQQIPDVRIVHYQEKAWGENHDVLAFGKPSWSELPESWPR